MLSAADHDCYEELIDLATCPSCARITRDIKLLPCMDFFCLPCLQQRLSQQTAGHEMDCPSCRQTFPVPQEGLQHLPSNSYIRAVVSAGPTTSRQAALSCSVCGKEKMTAELNYCKECRQCLCEQCATVHRKIRLTRTHHVTDARRSCLTLDCDTDACSRHPTKSVQVVCSDCASLCCLQCLREAHRDHNWSDVEQVSETFRRQLGDDVETVTRAGRLCEEQLEQLDHAERTLTGHMEAVRRQADSHYEQIIATVDHEIALLHDELSQAQSINVNKLRQSQDQIRKQKKILQCFERFCESIVKTGTAHEVIHVHNSTHEPDGEPLPLQHASCDAEITRLRFTPVQVYEFLPHQAQHLIGTVSADENTVTQYPTWNQLQGQLQQALEQVAQLQQQANDNQQSMSCLEDQLTHSNDLLEKTSKELQENNSLAVELEQRTSEMASEIKEKENVINSLKEELQQRDGVLDEYKTQLESTRQQLVENEQNYRSQMHQYELKLEKAAFELQESQHSEAECRLSVDEFNVRVQQLQESLTYSVNKEQQMETELEDALQHISEQSIIIDHVPPTAGE